MMDGPDIIGEREKRVAVIITTSTNSAYYSTLYLYTQTNYVCDLITLNYNTMTHCLGIYQGTVAFYSDQTRINVSDIKSEWI